MLDTILKNRYSVNVLFGSLVVIWVSVLGTLATSIESEKKIFLTFKALLLLGVLIFSIQLIWFGPTISRMQGTD